MRVLVSGGAGYIGSHAVDLLIREGHQVSVIDTLESGHREAVHPAAAFTQGDCGDAALVDGILGGAAFDAVMHFAAYIEAGDSMVRPGRFFVNNTARTLALVDRMIAHGVHRLIFSSTAATYGDPSYTPMDEDHPKVPTNAYGASKLLVEGALDWMSRLTPLRCASLRYFNVAGCSEELGEDHAPETHLIPLVLDVAQNKRQQITIFGTDYPTPDGTAVRDYVHVVDLATAHMLAMHALAEHPRLIYNLGNGAGYSVRQVIETAREVTGHAIPAVEAPRRAGDPAVLVASSDKIQRELGWAPKHRELAQMIGSAWRWRQRFAQGYATPGERPRWTAP